jgi:hypothetical protein
MTVSKSHIIRLTCIPTLLAFLLSLPSCGEKKKTQDSPNSGQWLEVKEAYYDFGKVFHGDEPSHSFWIENKSQQTVRLSGYRNACSCADVTLRIQDKKGEKVTREIHDPPIQREGSWLVTWLEPGEKLEVQVTVHTLVRAAVEHKEPGTTELHFEPDTEAGIVRFGYKFHILPRVRILPTPTLDLGSLGKEQKTVSPLELAPGIGIRPFKITKIEGVDEYMRLEPISPLEKHGFRYLLRFGPTHRAGSYQRILSFHTDLNGYIAKVQVNANILPNLQFFPTKQLNFGRIPFSKKGETFITLIYNGLLDDPKLKILETRGRNRKNEDRSSYFESKLEAAPEGRWTLKLLYKGGAAESTLRGEVLLQSQDPDHKRSTIPFVLFNREAR